MKTIIQFREASISHPQVQFRSNLVLIALAVSCFALVQQTQALSPAPGGGYPGFNTAEGQSALLALSAGTANTAVGWFSLNNNTDGAFNTAVGAGTLLSNVGNQGTGEGVNNTAVGAAALLLNTTGFDNTAVGVAALLYNSDGSFNTAIGADALFNNAGGSENSAFGWNALASNTTGFGNAAIGANALRNNTEGGTNTAIGVQALFTNTIGQDNTAIGYQALFFNDGNPSDLEGSDNCAFGSYALGNSTTGDSNSAFGWSALGMNTIGFDNTAIGTLALASNTDHHANTAVGVRALQYATGGSNIGLGDQAGFNVTTASNVICIGSGGDNIDNSCFIGNIYSNIQPVNGIDPDYVTITSSGRLGRSNLNGSSRRFKHDIQPMDKSSEVILALKPVSFHYNKEYDATQRLSFGLIAEEVADVAPDLVGRNRKGEPESVRYEQINAMLLNEFLKEHKKVEAQAHELEEQQATIADLKSAVAQQEKNFRAGLTEQQEEIKALESDIQRVSEQMDTRTPARLVTASEP